jgi:Ca-activated chloride channel family protein
MPAKANFYDLLGLPEDATPEEIRHAYREAALKMHPDVNAEPGAAELFIQIQQAYDVLSDPKRREVYNQRQVAEKKLPVRTDVLYSCPAVTIIDEPQLVYTLLDFSAAQKSVQNINPPINVCLVLDKSTSMQGERMDTVKKAAIELIRQLKPDDVLSLVVFSDRAEVLVPAGRRSDRGIIETQIHMIRPSGGTEIFQGLEAGFNEIQRNSNRTFVNHIILITDGRTYGDEDACLNLADHASLQGVRITGLGIGSEWNDNFMDELTSHTGGSTTYISKAGDIQKFLQERFASLNQIYAERVILDLETEPEVTLESAYRLQPDSTGLAAGPSIRLGSIPNTTKLSLLLEFLITSIPADITRFKLAAGELNLVLVNNPKFIHKIPIRLSRLTTDTPSTEMPPRPIFQALSQITLYRMQERARQEVAEGKVQEAGLRLQRLATQLISMGERELAQTALIEAERIQKTHLLSAEGEKKIKYGTRAFLLPSHIEREIS